MYYGTKGWYVAELKKLGVRYHEGRKLESYCGHVLRNLLIAQQEKLKNSNRFSYHNINLSPPTNCQSININY